MFAYLNVHLIIPMDLYGKESWDGDLMPLTTRCHQARWTGSAPLLAETFRLVELQRNRRAGRLRSSCG